MSKPTNSPPPPPAGTGTTAAYSGSLADGVTTAAYSLSATGSLGLTDSWGGGKVVLSVDKAGVATVTASGSPLAGYGSRADTGSDGEDGDVAPVATVTGTKGADVIDRSHDVVAHGINAGGGNDSILAGGFGDTIAGGDGNDTIAAGNGMDALDGGTGRDLVTYAQTFVGVTVDLAHGHGYGGADGDTYAGIEDAAGSAYADLLIAASGGSSLFGAAGNDVLVGGAGRDTLDGGAGRDAFFGGGGADTFVFSKATGWDGQQDTILDFHASEGDAFDLRGLETTAITAKTYSSYVALVDKADGTHVMFDAAGTLKATGGVDVAVIVGAHGLDIGQLYAAHNLIV